MKLHLTNADWLKLKNYNEIFAKEIQQSLPVDWPLTLDEISGSIYDTYISLAKLYKEGAMSFTSYCYRYAKQYTLRDLIREYKKLKQQDILFAIEPEEDEFKIKHQYGIYEFPDTKNITETIEQQDVLKDAYDKANKIDKLIMEMIYNGYSYEEIAKDLGLNKMDITRRMRKYGKCISQSK